MVQSLGSASNYSQEIASTICEALINGKSLRSICESDDMPAASTVCLWLTLHPDFAEQYARAREAQADTLADEILFIADTPQEGVKVKETEKGVEVWKGDMIEHRRLQVDSRKWIAARLKPKKYGDKLSTELTGPNGGPIETKSSVTTPGCEALLQRIRARLERSAAIGTPEGDAAIDPDGSVLPAALRVGPDGHGASVDALPDSGSAA